MEEYDLTRNDAGGDGARGRLAASNSAALMASNLLSRVFSVALLLVISRTLGEEVFGEYQLLLYFLMIFGFFCDMGLGTLVIREVGRHPERAQSYLSNTVVLMGVFGVVFAGLVVAVIALLGYSWSFILLALAGSLSILFLAEINALSAVINGLEWMRVPAFWQVVNKFAGLLLGVGAVLAGFGLPGLVVAYVLGSFVQLVGLLWSRRGLGLRLFKGYAPRLLWPLFREALPFALLGAVSLVYARLDMILLERLGPGGLAEVGYYAGALRLLEFFTFIPISVMLAVMPMMSQAYLHERPAMWHQYRVVVRLMAVVSFPLAVLCTLEGTEIVVLLYGASFAPAGAVMPWLAWAVFTAFLDLPALNIIKNSRRIWWFLVYVCGITVVSITLNAWVIPRWGFQGAAWVNLGTKVVDLLAFTLFLRLIARGPIGLVRVCSRPFLAALAMGLSVGLLREWSVLLTAPLGTAVYLAVLVAVGGIGAEERVLFRRLTDRLRGAARTPDDTTG
jgi:O-antigen/teichoic acid export membrane protein